MLYAFCAHITGIPTRVLGWLGIIDDAAVLTFVYNKLEDKVTPDVQRRVQDTIDEWFEVEYEVVEV